MDLCASVIPDKTTTQCFPTKVEVKLIKDKQCRWLNLEKTQEPIKTLDWDTSQQMKPEYPTSSKIKKDWAAIDKSVEEEKLEGDAVLHKLFKDIFARGSEDQQRAMNKSFYESGGTVLSTNWEDIGSRKVEGSAPKGCEIKEMKDLHN